MNFGHGVMWGLRVIGGDTLYTYLYELDPNQPLDEAWREVIHMVTGGIATRTRSVIGVANFTLTASVGLDSETDQPISLAYSDDNGLTWSPEFTIPLTDICTQQVLWNALGSFNYRWRRYWLDWRTSIVDKAGRPSPEFQRRWDAQRNNNKLIGSVTLGSGAPPNTPAPSDGSEYIDTSTVPYTLYTGNGGTWHQVSDVLNKIGVVEGDVLYRGVDTWQALTPGNAGEVLTTKGAGTGPVWQGVAGFTISCSGPVPANIRLGAASWGKTVTFNNSEPDNNGTALVSPLAAYAFNLLDTTLTQVGQITVTTAGLFTTVWDTSPLVWPAKKIMLIQTQTIQDTNLAGINNRTIGYF